MEDVTPTSAPDTASAADTPPANEEPQSAGLFVAHLLHKLLVCHGEAYDGANKDAEKLRALIDAESKPE